MGVVVVDVEYVLDKKTRVLVLDYSLFFSLIFYVFLSLSLSLCISL